MISKRLSTIASLLKGRRIIDVGADHGDFEQYVVNHNLADKVVAVENKEGPYFRLTKAVNKLDKVKPILSDGLAMLSEDIEVIVLAGMGGNLIVNILKKDFDKTKNVKQVLVDAHRDSPKVRKFLLENGFKIEKEIIVHEKKKHYFIISFVRGNQKLKESELLFGYKTNKDPLWANYYKMTYRLYSRLYALNNSDSTLNLLRRLEEHEHD